MISNDRYQFSVDDFVNSLKELETVASSETTEKILYREAMSSGKFVRAQLGVFRNKEDHSIWKLVQEDNGQEYIVRSENYDTPIEGDWSALPNRTGSAVTLAYKNTPIFCFAAAEHNIQADDVFNFAKYLVSKASNDPVKFASSLMKAIPFEERVALQKKFALFRKAST